MTTTYFDTSALVKIFLVDEEGSERAQAIWTTAESRVATNLVEVEARAALVRAGKGNRLTEARLRLAVLGVNVLMDGLTRVIPTNDLVARAARVADQEGLRAYDAVHLATALAAGAEVFVCADTELCAAAGRRGLAVANPTDG